MFIVLTRKLCLGLHENYCKALSSENEWTLFFTDDLVISPTSKSTELTLSSDLAQEQATI